MSPWATLLHKKEKTLIYLLSKQEHWKEVNSKNLCPCAMGPGTHLFTLPCVFAICSRATSHAYTAVDPPKALTCDQRIVKSGTEQKHLRFTERALGCCLYSRLNGLCSYNFLSQQFYIFACQARRIILTLTVNPVCSLHEDSHAVCKNNRHAVQ